MWTNNIKISQVDNLSMILQNLRNTKDLLYKEGHTTDDIHVSSVCNNVMTEIMEMEEIIQQLIARKK